MSANRISEVMNAESNGHVNGSVTGHEHVNEAATKPESNGHVNGSVKEHVNGAAPTPESNGVLDNGRTASGKFAKGNDGGPGNPYARQVAALKREMLEVMTAERVRAITLKLVEMAAEGNVAAAKLVLAYTLGRPAAALGSEPDLIDVHEWDVFEKEAGLQKRLDGVLKCAAPVLPLTLVRESRPEMTHVLARACVGALAGSDRERATLKRDLPHMSETEVLKRTHKLADKHQPKANGSNGGEKRALHFTKNGALEYAVTG